MFLYLFLAAALVTSTETPTTIDPELQEIVALFTADDAPSCEVNSTIITPTTTVAAETSIIITNAIEPSMIAYKHWTGTYNPDIFTIKVNGVEVAQGAQHMLDIAHDPIEIRYDYSFVNGKRTGAKIVSYQLNENITQANITFSWNDDWRVLVDNGKPVKQEEIT
jgi:hypothetical protein